MTGKIALQHAEKDKPDIIFEIKIHEFHTGVYVSDDSEEEFYKMDKIHQTGLTDDAYHMADTIRRQITDAGVFAWE